MKDFKVLRFLVTIILAVFSACLLIVFVSALYFLLRGFGIL